MKVFFFPTISITISLGLGIIFFNYYPMAFGTILCLFSLEILVLIFLSKIKKPSLTTLNILSIWITIGLFSCYIKNDLNYDLHYTKQSIENEKQEIGFVITEKLKSSDYSDKFMAEIWQINQKKAFGKIIVYTEKKIDQELQIGSTILCYTFLKPISNPKNPYQFSYANYLANQNIYAQIKLNTKNYKSIGINSDLKYYVNKVRTNIINSFNIHNFTTNTQQFINAFLLGQRQELNKEINEQYTHAGVVHVLAISGLHVSILYGILLLGFKAIKFGYKQRYLQLVITLAFLWGFALVTGLSASVLRCVTMFSIIAIAMTFGKNPNIYNAIAISLLILLLINPNILFDIGFQLSYLSVLIIIISNPLLKKNHFTRYKVVHYVLDLIAISFLVQLFLLPVILYYFNQFPILFLLANILVIPLSTVILYLLVAVLVLNYIYVPLSIYLGKIVSTLINFMNQYVEWIATYKQATISNIPFNEILLICLYLVIITIFLNLFKVNYKRIMYLLGSCVILSIGLIYSIENQKKLAYFMVWSQYKQTLLSQHETNKINLFTDDQINREEIIKIIQQNNFYKPIEKQILKNYYISQSKKIALINSDKYYNKNFSTDYLILSKSPKINLERVIEIYKPKFIIFDSNNYKTYVTRWEKTCKQKNIPFYNTYKMGYYRIDAN